MYVLDCYCPRTKSDGKVMISVSLSVHRRRGYPWFCLCSCLWSCLEVPLGPVSRPASGFVSGPVWGLPGQDQGVRPGQKQDRTGQDRGVPLPYTRLGQRYPSRQDQERRPSPSDRIRTRQGVTRPPPPQDRLRHRGTPLAVTQEDFLVNSNLKMLTEGFV